MLRQRKNLVKFIQDLDAFPKVEEDHQEKTASGGGLSLLVFSLIAILVLFEVNHYLDEGVRYHYDIDPHFDKKLKLNIDIIVAMKCSDVGADILDITGENADKFGSLKEENVVFELSPQQQKRFDSVRLINGHVKKDYHLLHDRLWRQVKRYPQVSVNDLFSYVKDDSGQRTNACRFHGTLEVNKVAGNFHITAGKSINFGNNHMHISFDDESTVFNFSHRILHFSFGDSNSPLLNPLDAELKISDDSTHMWQYFIQVVPTTASSLFHQDTELYQYAVTEQNRSISHPKGSHGLPGIYVKYDLSPLRVKVEDGSSTLVQLVVRLCGIVGGVFATSSMLHLIVSGLINMVLCKWEWKSSSAPPYYARSPPNNQEIPQNGNGSILSNKEIPNHLVSLVSVQDESQIDLEKIPNVNIPISLPMTTADNHSNEEKPSKGF